MNRGPEQKARREARRALGLCVECDRPLFGKALCRKHQLIRRRQSRSNYRKRSGIPANSPLIQRGRSRIEKPKMIAFQGESRSLREWSMVLGFDHDLVERRLKRNWPTERAFTEPKHSK